MRESTLPYHSTGMPAHGDGPARGGRPLAYTPGDTDPRDPAR